jgi:hypothetical protein
MFVIPARGVLGFPDPVRLNNTTEGDTAESKAKACCQAAENEAKAKIDVKKL